MSQAQVQFDSSAATAFCKLLAERPALLKQPSDDFQHQLMQALPERPTEAYIIAQAYRHGVTELLNTHQTAEPLADALAEPLENACGMQAPAIQFAAEAWARTLLETFGQDDRQGDFEEEATPEPEHPPASAAEIDIPSPEHLPSVGDRKRVPDYQLPEGFELTGDPSPVAARTTRHDRHIIREH